MSDGLVWDGRDLGLLGWSQRGALNGTAGWIAAGRPLLSGYEPWRVKVDWVVHWVVSWPPSLPGLG
jgi:hypothetical protein